MEYQIIQAQSAVDLGQTVQARLNDGWALYGNPVISQDRDVLLYSQAITRKRRRQQKVRYAQR